ncbi:unnamed protein product [Sympodiomycopsis kandeliae]
MDSLSRIVEATPILRDLPLFAQVFALGTLFLFASVLLNVIQQCLPKPASSPPVVFHWFPIIGSAVTYGMNPYKFFFDNRQKYGDVFTFVMIGRKVTVALGRQGTNLVFNGKLADVCAEDVYAPVTVPVFGKDAVYDVPNAVLMEQKRFVKAGLTTDNFRVYVGQIEEESEQFLTNDPTFAPLSSKSSVEANIFKTMSELTILTASRTLQGQEVRDNMDKSVAHLYHDLDQGFTPLNYILPGLPLPANFRRDKAQQKMCDFYTEIIKRRRAAGDDAKESKHHDMIATLLQQKYKNGRSLTDREMSSIMIALLMAGQHTSSATSAWALLRLASKPELIQELYDEQVKVYGDGNGGFTPLNYETSKSSLPFMDAVIRETLRMHPPLHSLMRRVKRDLVVPPTASSSASAGKRTDDISLVIPKGHNVLAAPGVSALDPELWDSPQEFLPSRWIDRPASEEEEVAAASGTADTVDYGWGAISTSATSAYLPFGAGRHRCIGEQFAYVQLGAILATFVRKFDWKLKNGHMPEPDYTSMVVLPTAPSAVVITKRS